MSGPRPQRPRVFAARQLPAGAAGQLALEGAAPKRARGIVYIVGAGPGDPGLITVRGLACLRRADVVAYDRLVARELLAEAPPAAERIDVGKTPGCHSPRQEDIAAVLVARAASGKVVVRLKGGDPFVFGRGGEEALACAAAGVDWEVVPGVTSATAVPALAGIPVTHRGMARGFTVVSGHCLREDLDWPALARAETLVVLMGLERLPVITGCLLAAGKAATTPAALIVDGSLPGERVLLATLGDIAATAAAAGARPPATLVVGEVVSLRARLSPREGSRSRATAILVPGSPAWRPREGGTEVSRAGKRRHSL
jgi:uroporphyrin-III C-methyltransferase